MSKTCPYFGFHFFWTPVSIVVGLLISVNSAVAQSAPSPDEARRLNFTPFVVDGEVTRGMRLIVRVTLPPELNPSSLKFECKVDESDSHEQPISIPKPISEPFQAVFDVSKLELKDESKRLRLRLSLEEEGFKSRTPFSEWTTFRIVSDVELCQHSLARMKARQHTLADGAKLLSSTASAIEKWKLAGKESATDETRDAILTASKHIAAARQTVSQSTAGLVAEWTIISSAGLVEDELSRRLAATFDSWEAIETEQFPMLEKTMEKLMAAPETDSEGVTVLLGQVNNLSAKTSGALADTQELTDYFELVLQVRQLIQHQEGR